MRSLAFAIVIGAFVTLPGVVFGITTGQWQLALLFCGVAVPVAAAGTLARSA